MLLARPVASPCPCHWHGAVRSSLKLAERFQMILQRQRCSGASISDKARRQHP